MTKHNKTKHNKQKSSSLFYFITNNVILSIYVIFPRLCSAPIFLLKIVVISSTSSSIWDLLKKILFSHCAVYYCSACVFRAGWVDFYYFRFGLYSTQYVQIVVNEIQTAVCYDAFWLLSARCYICNIFNDNHLIFWS